MSQPPRIVRYLTHPQVAIDPIKPVPLWGLSPLGHTRASALAQSAALSGTTRIISSAETKAIETAEIVAKPLGLAIVIREATHENDRSATGFLPPPEFEATANQFFAEPERSVRGWERAIDAQRRIVQAVTAELAADRDGDGDVLFVGHGGVGTLLLCHIAGCAIDRKHDQGPGGGGNIFAFARDDGRLLHAWQSIETFIAVSA
jgi:broad specificity phosphatase PhoE